MGLYKVDFVKRGRNGAAIVKARNYQKALDDVTRSIGREPGFGISKVEKIPPGKGILYLRMER